MTSTSIALQALGQALKLEQQGREFYLRAVEETVDPKGQALFRSLADDERVHAEAIRRQIHNLEGGGSFVLPPDIAVPDIDLNAKLFPPEAARLEAKVGVNPSDVDALHVALENEIKAYDLYRAAAQATADPVGKQIYQWLAGAEIVHFNLLMANYEATVSGSSWV